jgi:hypothetical protein
MTDSPEERVCGKVRIHPSAWKGNSAKFNFALTGFSEIRVLRGHALRCGSWHHTHRWEGFDPLGS